MAIKHKFTLMCDEVRREDNGKLLIMGLYMDSIGLPQIPYALPSLTFFQILESDRPGTWGMKFKIEHLESGSRLLEGGGQMAFPRPGLGVNNLRFGNLLLTNPGIYNFVLEIEGQQADPIIVPFSVILNLPQTQQQLNAIGLGGR
jgi:hypothetical protein